MKNESVSANNNERHGALDILASVVSNVQDFLPKKNLPEHRVSCHRCGNIRKRKLLCPRQSCPHIFCGRCADKMLEEHGEEVFADGCPVCQELCCCSNKSVSCNRQNHCYRKCPSTKGKSGVKTEDGSAEADYHISAPALEILAQVVSDPFRSFYSSRPTSPEVEVKKRKIDEAISPGSSAEASFHDQPMNVVNRIATSPTSSLSGHYKYPRNSGSPEPDELSPKARASFRSKPYTPDAASLSANYAMSSLSALSAAAGNYDQCTVSMKSRVQQENIHKKNSQTPVQISQPASSSPLHSEHLRPTPEKEYNSNPGLPGLRDQSMSSYLSHPQYMATAAALTESSYESYAPSVRKKSDVNSKSSKI